MASENVAISLRDLVEVMVSIAADFGPDRSLTVEAKWWRKVGNDGWSGIVVDGPGAPLDFACDGRVGGWGITVGSCL
ncbi:hypothetical protein RYX36_025632 [Vicia faba]